MRKISTFLIMVILVFNMTGCSSCSPVENQPSNAQTESKVQEESKAPEQKLSASDFLKAILQKDAATSEVSARQQLWKEGYSPAEIKEAIDSAFPKSQTDAKKEESSVVEESSKQDESSKAAENSDKQESSKVSEVENSEESRQQASGGTESSQSASESQTGTGSQSTTGGTQASQGGSVGGSTASSGGQSTSESQSQQQTQEQPSQSSQPEQPAHTHTWVDVTEVVHHDAVTEQVWVVDEAAWDETVNKTETKEVNGYKCRCGLVFTDINEFNDNASVAFQSFLWKFRFNGTLVPHERHMIPT